MFYKLQTDRLSFIIDNPIKFQKLLKLWGQFCGQIGTARYAVHEFNDPLYLQLLVFNAILRSSEAQLVPVRP